MDRNVFLSILAMDSYNRGYGRAIKLSDTIGTHLGDAEIIARQGNAVEQAAGFYAIAYDLFGEKIISYRGTDQNLSHPWNPTGSDLVNGYGVGAGSPYGDQAGLTIDFFRTVAGLIGGGAQGANITTTGHSLGGGLAGFAAYDLNADGVIELISSASNDNAAIRLAA